MNGSERHLVRFDLLPVKLGGPPYHQSCNKHRKDNEDEHGIQPGANTAEDNLAELHSEQLHEPAEWHE